MNQTWMGTDVSEVPMNQTWMGTGVNNFSCAISRSIFEEDIKYVRVIAIFFVKKYFSDNITIFEQLFSEFYVFNTLFLNLNRTERKNELSSSLFFEISTSIYFQ